MPGIFISYRRDDTAGYAGRLADGLTAHFGAERVFMDAQALRPGMDYVEAIEQSIGSCDILILLIGRRWLTTVDADGHRRLDDPTDLHRIEIASALKRDLRVIPVLVDGGRMPRQEDLPADLALLARRQACEIDDASWRYDVQQLIGVLDEEIQRRELERLYADAAQASDRQAWDLAIRGFEAVLARNPAYRDAADRLKEAERQKRLSELYAQGRELHRARRWHDVDAAFQRIHALDPAYGDPDHLLDSARRALADQAPDNEVAALYAQGRLHVEFRRWSQALETLEALQARQPGYRDTEALLLRARRELQRRQSAGSLDQSELEAEPGFGDGVEVPPQALGVSVLLGALVGAALAESGYVLVREPLGPLLFSLSWWIGAGLATAMTALALTAATRHRRWAVGIAIVVGLGAASLDAAIYSEIRVPLGHVLEASRVSFDLQTTLDWALMMLNAMVCVLASGLLVALLACRRNRLIGLSSLLLVAVATLAGAALGVLGQLAIQYLIPWPDEIWSAWFRFVVWLLAGGWLLGWRLTRPPTFAGLRSPDSGAPRLA
jgi:hypothetical protein